MSSRTDIESLLLAAINEVNEHLPEDKLLRKSLETRLVSNENPIDSLALISFVVVVEDLVEARYGIPLSLTDNEALLEDPNGPLRSLAALTEHLMNHLRDQDHGTQ